MSMQGEVREINMETESLEPDLAHRSDS